MTVPVQPASLGSEADQVLADLVAEFANKLHAGEPVDVSAYAREHPEHAEELRRLLPDVQVLAELGHSAGASASAGVPLEVMAGPPFDALGDFRLLREVGRGGMGVVYEAEQLSLRRRVALKVLPFAAALDPKQLQRFKQEAEAAAHLHHTHIVPVHFVGCERGVHFYAMQFIDGQTLAAVISGLRQESEPRPSGSGGAPPLPDGRGSESTALLAALPTERSASSPAHFRTVARLGVQAAEALEHAHQLGVVHRDIKPANLLVDGRGHLWVTDFGLARFQSEAGLTLTGDLLGTLRYMSPEQALAKHALVDHRTDLYALGATLYELLTLHPACDGRDRQEVLRQIEHEEPRPPRRLNPTVPADLETVVLKALTKEPEGRYATAQELADDLRRFLEDKPIRARRPTLVQRARKWARRHRPVVASLVAGGVALLLTVAVTATVAAVRINAAKKHAQDVAAQFQLLTAELELEKAQSFEEQGDANLALLWGLRSLKSAPADAADLQGVIRMNLGAWRSQIHPLRRILPHTSQVRSVAFASDGKTFWTATRTTVQSWDTATDQPGQAMSYGREASAQVAVFSPDRRTLLLGYEDGVVWLLDLATGEKRPLVKEDSPITTAVTTAAFSPKGEKVLIGYWGPRQARGPRSGRACLWEVANGKRLTGPLEHKHLVHAAAFHPDGQTFVTECGIWRDTPEPGEARFWDLHGNEIRKPLQHPRLAMSVAYSPDGQQLLTGHFDAKVRLYDLTTDQAVYTLTHEAPARAVAFSLDGKTILTGSFDCTARLWDRATGQALSPPLWHQGMVHCVEFSPDGRSFLTGSFTTTIDSSTRLWEVAADSPALPPLPEVLRFFPLAFSPDCQTILTQDAEQTVRLCNAGTGELLGAPLGHRGPVTAGAFSPNDQTAVTVEDQRTVRLWDTATGKVIDELRHDDTVHAVAFSPDGRTVATGTWAGKAWLWDVATRTSRAQLRHDVTGAVKGVAFGPDGKLLLTGGKDGTARFWDTATGKEVGPPLTHYGGIPAVAFSPHGRLALTGGSVQFAQLWDVETRKPFGPQLSLRGGLRAVAFSPDGRFVVTGSRDQIARLWDVATGKLIGPPLRHAAPVESVAFWLDGRTILTAGEDQLTRFWLMPMPMTGTLEQMELWAQVVTGMELEANGGVRVLDAATWRERWQKLAETSVVRGP